MVRAKRGEPDAYEEIVRMHQTIAFRTAWLITRSDADAEEAAQDAFVKAHAALGRFREGAPFRPWLLAIVANEARNRLRSAGRRAGLALRVAEERRPDDAVPSPEAALLDSEQREELLAAIERLPEPAREAIACRYLLDLSEEETAAARSASPARRPAARRRLRASLATMAGSQGRNGAPARKRGSARHAFTNASCAASSASAEEPATRHAVRKAMSWCARTSAS